VRANNYSLIVLAPFSGVAAKLLWGLIISAGVSCVTATKSHAAERQYGDLYILARCVLVTLLLLGPSSVLIAAAAAAAF
jgi:hypothetical protein